MFKISANVSVALFFYCCFVVIHSFPQWKDLETKRDGQILQLKFLGSADGKSYFFEPNQNMTWNNAETFCRSFGLKFASIETSEQVDFLSGQLYREAKNVEFWSSAKSAALTTSVNFTFVDKNSEMKPSLFYEWKGIPLQVPEYCVTVRALSSPSYKLVLAATPRDCSSLRYVLCYHT